MPPLRSLVLVLAPLALLLKLVDQPAFGNSRFDGVDEYVEAAMKTWETPGLAIAVVKDGEVVLTRGYGVREIGTDRRVDADTLFPIASCAKSFVAASIGVLIDEGSSAGMTRSSSICPSLSCLTLSSPASSRCGTCSATGRACSAATS